MAMLLRNFADHQV
jgi:hypothetical protein